jgi:hypothetical protein
VTRGRWLSAALVGLLVASGAAACKKREDKAPPAAGGALTLTEVEIKRGQDACAAYQQRVCELAAKKPERADLAEGCKLAPARGEAMRTALEIAQHPETARRDVLQAQDSVRKTMDHCIEDVAKLAGE